MKFDLIIYFVCGAMVVSILHINKNNWKYSIDRELRSDKVMPVFEERKNLSIAMTNLLRNLVFAMNGQLMKDSQSKYLLVLCSKHRKPSQMTRDKNDYKFKDDRFIGSWTHFRMIINKCFIQTFRMSLCH